MFRLPNVHVSPAKRTCFACQTCTFCLPNVHVLGAKQRVKKFTPNGCLQMVIKETIRQEKHYLYRVVAQLQLNGTITLNHHCNSIAYYSVRFNSGNFLLMYTYHIIYRSIILYTWRKIMGMIKYLSLRSPVICIHSNNAMHG